MVIPPMQRRRRILISLLAASAAGLTAGVAISACSTGETVATAAAPAVAREPTPEERIAAIPDRSEPTLDEIVAMGSEPGHASIVQLVKGAEVKLHDAPRGEVIATVGDRTEFGSPTAFSVAERHGDWVGVPAVEAGNGNLAWIELDPQQLVAGVTGLAVEVDLSDYTASLLRDGREVRSFPVTIGAAGSPTPTGRFAVSDKLRGDLGPAYGCCAIALSAIQPSLPSGWMGGNRIAIHGNTGGSLGVAASHGCIRADDDDVASLVDMLPLGTPVTVQA
jgi:lipoprotein-anchoring transpeptidase ErfK/SrfK